MPVRGTEILPPSAFVILASLRRGDAHGYALMKEIKNRSRGRFTVSPSTLYPRLRFLEQAGLIVRSQTRRVAGRAKVYSLTDRGHRKLVAELDRLSALAVAQIQQGDPLVGAI